MPRTALFALVFVVGSAAGWFARERPTSARPEAAADTSNMVVSYPDAANPAVRRSVRLAVRWASGRGDTRREVELDERDWTVDMSGRMFVGRIDD